MSDLLKFSKTIEVVVEGVPGPRGGEGDPGPPGRDGAKGEQGIQGGAWDPLVPYSEGEYVERNGVLYGSLQNQNLDHAPETTLGVWWDDVTLSAITLGDAASLNVGTTPGTVATGDHGHAISDVNALQIALDGKSDDTHGHDNQTLTGVTLTGATFSSYKEVWSEVPIAAGIATINSSTSQLHWLNAASPITSIVYLNEVAGKSASLHVVGAGAITWANVAWIDGVFPDNATGNILVILLWDKDANKIGLWHKVG